MKKSLIALAVFGAFSGAALAQSNVTLYGILDVNYQRNDPSESTCYTNFSGPGGTLAATCDADDGINGGHQSGNRFGLRGSEALGNNLNVIFTLEGGFSIDTGVSGQAGRLFGRQAWVGLQGNLGSVVAGRIATVSSGTGSFDMFGQVDPYVTGFGDSGVQNTFSSAGALRMDNTILYKSPTWAGFTFGGQYSTNAVGSESAVSSQNMDAWGVGVSWGAGPFYIVATYDSIDPPSNIGVPLGSDNQTNLQIGGTFDFKIVKLHAAYAIEEAVWFTTGGGGSVTLETVAPGSDADAWMVGVTVRLFGGELLASYQDRDGDSIVIAGVTRERDLSVWSVGYTYPLSRRTNLYINYSDKDGDKSANGVVSLDRSQFTMGMRHLF